MGSAKGVLLGPLKGRFSGGSADFPWRNTSCLEAWAEALKWDYIGSPFAPTAELDQYDFVISNSTLRLVPALTKLAHARRKGQFWITLIEGAGEDYFEQTAAIKVLLDASDLVISINHHTLPFWRSVTTTRVENIGIPYPLSYVSEFATPFGERNTEVLVAPRANAGPSAVVAQHVGGGVVYAERMARTARNHLATGKSGIALRRHNLDSRKAALGEAGLEYRFELPVTEFYREAGRMSFWINLDPRHTWARFVLDGAALGMPQITTSQTDHGPHLYPDTVVDSPLDLERARRIATRLKSDEEFRRHVGASARERIETYEMMQAESRLREVIGLR